MGSKSPVVDIKQCIYLIRGKKVMLDRDLAKLYGVTTFNFNKAVKRNLAHFPADFMFQLSKEESQALRFQFGILKKGQHPKYLPHAFTEQGVAMLSGVLNSEKAVQVNIQIIRNFVRLRQLLATNEQLVRKLQEIEKRYDSQFQQVFRIITKLMVAEAEPKRGGKLGFFPPRDNKRRQK